MPRSTLVSPFSRARRAGLRLRRRIAPLTLAALATLALAGPIATPAHASVDSESYMRCVNTVADWTDACTAASGNFFGDAACIAVGAAGILGCAAIEAAKHLGGTVHLE